MNATVSPPATTTDAPETGLSALDDGFVLGSPVIVLRRGGGFQAQMCFAAESFDAEAADLLVRHSSGFVLATVTEMQMLRLGLTLMQPRFDRDSGRFCVAVDAASGGTTGISGTDRARTIGVLADVDTRAGDLTRPGHVVPVAVGGAFSAARWSIYDSIASLSLVSGLSGVVATASLVDGARDIDEQFVRALADRLGSPVIEADDLAVTTPTDGWTSR